MARQIIQFSAILFTALALVPAGAHLMALPNKMRLPADSYLVAQSIYRGWALAGFLVLAALLATLAHAIVLRGQRGFTAAIAAFACIVGTRFIFWTFTYPANAATSQWMVLPENWEHLRTRWEYSHAASAVLNLVALVATSLGVLRSR